MDTIISSLFETEVEVKIEDDSKHAYLHQKFFINKVRKVTWCYSLEWSDSAIVADLNKCRKYPQEIFILKRQE